MHGTKAPVQSIGIMGPIIALVVFGVNQIWPGIGMTEVEASQIVDQAMLVFGGLTGIYGRWRATKRIGRKAA